MSFSRRTRLRMNGLRFRTVALLAPKLVQIVTSQQQSLVVISRFFSASSGLLANSSSVYPSSTVSVIKTRPPPPKLGSRFLSLNIPEHQIYNSPQFTMTNKPRIILKQNTNNHSTDTTCVKTSNGLVQTKTTRNYVVPAAYTLPHSPAFQNMAGIQKLAMEPTREHIEHIRHVLKNMNAKNNDNQQITLEKDHESGIASVCIRSAAKNGISGKMMCDFLDIIDELQAWQEGKGVILYGHKGFFCSGKMLLSLDLS